LIDSQFAKTFTIDFLSLLADCSNQNGFEKQTVKIRFKKISPGVYQHS
jgi:hypothetical protein